MFGDTRVRTGYLLLGMLKTPSLRAALLSHQQAIRTRQADDLCDASPLCWARPKTARGPATAAARPAKPAAPSPRPPWASRKR
jgi:hypothetical protein